MNRPDLPGYGTATEPEELKTTAEREQERADIERIEAEMEDAWDARWAAVNEQEKGQ